MFTISVVNESIKISKNFLTELPLPQRMKYQIAETTTWPFPTQNSNSRQKLQIGDETKQVSHLWCLPI